MTQILAAAVGTVAFSLLFSVPRIYYPYCGLIGGVGWLIYCGLEGLLSIAEATFFAAVGVIFLSRLFAVWERCPVTLFLIPGIFPLVPGAGVYWTSYYIVMGKLDLALVTGFEALKMAVPLYWESYLFLNFPREYLQKLQKSRRWRGKNGGMPD